ncbi:MAG: neutral zinc metallopeptidase [Acidobacteria bacterium]|nr:neutral zinc metallopeptidase [Acidobacteriota bacterium]
MTSQRRLGRHMLVAMTMGWMAVVEPPPHAQRPLGPASPALLPLIDVARRDIDQYWASRVTGYRPPVDVVMVRAPQATDCGPFQTPNARYCPSTHKIYWDIGLFEEQLAFGDFAPVFILAHEWGHLIQQLIGALDTARGYIGIQVELQADCLAGEYAANARQRGLLERGDDNEATLALQRGGDGLDDPWFDVRAHGTAGQRIDAFAYGFGGRSCTDGRFFEFLKARGIDASRVPQTPAPSAGRLDAALPRTAGRFIMLEVKRVQVQGALDALKARYRTVNGMYLEVAALSYPTVAEARAAVDREVAEMIARAGLREIRRTLLVDEKDRASAVGVEVVLQGRLEYVVWSNRHLLGIVEGPLNVGLELYSALPF